MKAEHVIDKSDFFGHDNNMLLLLFVSDDHHE